MATLLAIGEFSRMTYLSVKALRHYDDVGLLEPADVDPSTGNRRYSVAQVPTAQVIRRFRDLDMPIDRIKAVITAPDPDTRDRLIVAHLAEMEAKLDQTQQMVASLRTLLAGGGSPSVERRTIPTITALTASAAVRWDDTEGWLDDALAALGREAGGDRAGPDGALYPTAYFEDHEGEVVAFAPVAGGEAEIAGGEHAVMVHVGPFDGLDAAYAALGTYVTERGIGAAGAVREHYLPTDDPAAPRTEVCWPVRVT